jgi:hypothetical protein
MDDSDKQKSPFASLEEEYSGKPATIVAHKTYQAFFAMFGIPSNLISTEFKKFTEETCKKIHPRYHCSAARAIIEGRIPGVPSPVMKINKMWEEKVNLALHLLDFFETLLQLHSQRVLLDASEDLRDDAKALTDVVGTTKVPLLFEFLEKYGATEDKKTKKGNARGSSGKEHDRDTEERWRGVRGQTKEEGDKKKRKVEA